jgi:hypothetical protein
LADHHDLENFASSEASLGDWLRLGFDECPGQPMMLVVTLADLRAALA